MKTFPISESLFLNRGLWYLGMALSVVILMIAIFEYWKNRKDKRPNLSLKESIAFLLFSVLGFILSILLYGMTVPNGEKSIEDSFVTTAPVVYLDNSYLVTEGPKSWVVAFVKTDDTHFYLNRISGADGLPTPK